MNQLPLSLKLALFLGALMVVGLAVLSQVTLTSQNQLIERQFSIFGGSVTQQLAESAVEPLFTEDKLMLDRLAQSLLRVAQVSGAAILAHDGQVVSTAGTQPPDYNANLDSVAVQDTPELWQSTPWGTKSTDNPNAPYVTFGMPIQFQNTRAGTAYVVVSHAQIADTLNQTKTFLLMSTGILMVSLVIGIIWIARIIMRPLKALDHATVALGHGDFSYRINKTFSGEFQRLVNAFNRMAADIERQFQVEVVLKRLVPNQVSQQFLPSQTDVQLGSKRIQATIVFADIVGFTSLSEKWAPELIENLLNQVFTIMSASTHDHGGFVDKYIGDEAMMVFGIPDQTPDQEIQAIRTAISIQRRIHDLDMSAFDPKAAPIRLKIGLTSGTVLAGLFGADQRMQYTLIGDAVNVASRLTQMAEPGQILTTEDVAKRAKSQLSILCSASKPLVVKGKADAIHTCSILPDSYIPPLSVDEHQQSHQKQTYKQTYKQTHRQEQEQGQ